MPVAAATNPQALESQHPRRKRWTRIECESLQASGLPGFEHLELIQGELIDKMGKKRPHTAALTLVRLWLDTAFGAVFVNTESSVNVAPADNPTNEPEPDIFVLKRTYSGNWTTIPGPSDLDLVVEISDTTVAFDRTVKADLYARAGIADYWVLDIPGRRLIVHRDPKDGQYASVIAYSEQEPVAPLAAPDSFFHAAQALPE